MELRCTCGAVLPEEARFCHKCGKPQYEEDIARLSPAETASPTPVQGPLDVPGQQTPAAAIGFGNLRAVTVTIAVAAVALLPLALSMIAAPLGLVVLCLAGYCGAHFYRKQTSQPLTVGGGAYLGVMTGIWLFLVFAISAAIVGIEVGSPAGREALKAALARMPDAAKLLEDPHEFLVRIGQSLVFMFFLVTLASAFGGMIAARMPVRRSQP